MHAKNVINIFVSICIPPTNYYVLTCTNIHKNVRFIHYYDSLNPPHGRAMLAPTVCNMFIVWAAIGHPKHAIYQIK